MYRACFANFSSLVTVLICLLILPTPAQQSRAGLPDRNAVPYLSCYYVEPKVKATEGTEIRYYVTDADHSEYLKDDKSHVFTIEYWINDVKTTVPNVQAGDNKLVLKTLSPGKVLFALQAMDPAGRKSQRLFQEFLVLSPGSDIIPATKVLEPDLARFQIFNDDTHPVETTRGLTEMLKWASDNGYRKVLLPKGRYRLDENTPVLMATKLVLDLNGSTFKLNPNALAKSTMVKMVDCYDSHIMNGTFEGDLKEHDFKTAPNNSEWVNAFEMGRGTEYCSLEDVKIVDVTGYGSCTGIGDAHGKVGTAVAPKAVGGFELGDVDAKGTVVPSSGRTTSSKLMDISSLHGVTPFLQLGLYLGYQGNPANTWVYKASFYDEEQKYLESIEGYLYRRLYYPKTAKFVRFTILSTAAPANLSVFAFRLPYNCAFIKVHHENIRCVGMVPSGFVNLLVEGNTFENCGWSAAKCAFDAEDGWDMMQDLTFRNNVFGKNPANEFLTCAGHNFIMENNTMKVYMWDRTKGAIFRNNKIKSASFLFGNRLRTSYPRITGNEFEGVVKLETMAGAPDDLYVARDNVYKGGVLTSANKDGHMAASFSGGEIQGGILNAKVVGAHIRDVQNVGGGFIIQDSQVENCYLKSSGKTVSRVSGSKLENCEFVTVGSAIQLEGNTLKDVKCSSVQDWSDFHCFDLVDNKITTSLPNLVYVGNSFNEVTLRGNQIEATNPQFAAVYVNNATNEKLERAAVTIENNAFKAAGGNLLNIARKPAPGCVMKVVLKGNKGQGLELSAQDLSKWPNIQVELN